LYLAESIRNFVVPLTVRLAVGLPDILYRVAALNDPGSE